MIVHGVLEDFDRGCILAMFEPIVPLAVRPWHERLLQRDRGPLRFLVVEWPYAIELKLWDRPFGRVLSNFATAHFVPSANKIVIHFEFTVSFILHVYRRVENVRILLCPRVSFVFTIGTPRRVRVLESKRLLM